MSDTKSKLLHTAALERVRQLREYAKDPDAHKPIPVGLKDLEFILKGGFPRTPFYVAIVGEDKMGKSTLGKQIVMAYGLATGARTAIYDLEETESESVDRALTMRSVRVNRNDIYRMDLTEKDLDELEFYANSMEGEEIYINDQLTKLDDILKDSNENKFEVIGIDNFQLMTDGKGANQREMLVSLSKRLMYARQQGKKIFLMSQGNPDGKSFGSTQVQMDANGVILIDKRYQGKKKTDPVDGIRLLTVTRCRWAGTGTCEVLFQPEFSRVRTAETKTIDLKKEFINYDEEIPEDLLQGELGLYQ